MPRTREEILQERRQLRAEYGHLFDAVSALFFRHDPIGIAFDNENTDEYDPETRTILPRLRNCESSSDVLRVVHEETTEMLAQRSGTLKLLPRFGSCGCAVISYKFPSVPRNMPSAGSSSSVQFACEQKS